MREFSCGKFAQLLAALTGIDETICYRICHEEVYLNDLGLGDGKHRKVSRNQRAAIVLKLLVPRHLTNDAQPDENRDKMREFLRSADEDDPSAVLRATYEIHKIGSALAVLIEPSFLLQVLNGQNSSGEDSNY